MIAGRCGGGFWPCRLLGGFRSWWWGELFDRVFDITAFLGRCSRCFLWCARCPWDKGPPSRRGGAKSATELHVNSAQELSMIVDDCPKISVSPCTFFVCFSVCPSVPAWSKSWVLLPIVKIREYGRDELPESLTIYGVARYQPCQANYVTMFWRSMKFVIHRV